MIYPHHHPLSALHPWPDNYNRNDISSIALSIRQFGFNNAIRVWQSGIVAAGNHSFQALQLIRTEGARPGIDLHYPPKNILIDGDEWYVPSVDVSFLTETQMRAFAIADNELARKSTRDDHLLAQYLQEIEAESVQMLQATGFSEDELDALLEELARDVDTQPATSDVDEDEEGETSDGSLLALTQVTIAEPRHQVERGEVWLLGEHVLICADVLKDWQQWKPYLKGEETIFAPYPGPFVPLTIKADSHRFVMVQPDPYIAGHILDRYTDVKGANSVRKRD